MKMNKGIVGLVGVMAMTTALSAGAIEVDNTSASASLRPRVEFKEVGSADVETAVTNRFQANVDMEGFTFPLIGELSGLGVHIQATKVSDLGQNDHSSISDVEGDSLTRANLTYSVFGADFTLGLQGLALGNERMLGNSDWSQAPRVYNGLNVAYAINKKAAVNGTIISSIFDANFGSEMKSENFGSLVLSGSYDFHQLANVAGYAIMLENSSDTYGVTSKGSTNVSGYNVGYFAEFAIQGDNSLGDTDKNIDTTYYNIEGNANVAGVDLGIGYEVFGEAGDGNSGFSAALGTTHQFNGLADAFNTKNGLANGLTDISFSAGYDIAGIGRVTGAYHLFSAAEGDADYGTEIDLTFTREIFDGIDFNAQVAAFSAEDGSGYEDITSFTVFGTANF